MEFLIKLHFLSIHFNKGHYVSTALKPYAQPPPQKKKKKKKKKNIQRVSTKNILTVVILHKERMRQLFKVIEANQLYAWLDPSSKTISQSADSTNMSVKSFKNGCKNPHIV